MASEPTLIELLEIAAQAEEDCCCYDSEDDSGKRTARSLREAAGRLLSLLDCSPTLRVFLREAVEQINGGGAPSQFGHFGSAPLVTRGPPHDGQCCAVIRSDGKRCGCTGIGHVRHVPAASPATGMEPVATMETEPATGMRPGQRCTRKPHASNAHWWIRDSDGNAFNRCPYIEPTPTPEKK